jgi:CheY-like chemotaxis protein
VVIEDNPADIFLVKEAITAHALDVDTYVMSDGEEGMRFFRDLDANNLACPAVLLLDLNIPKVDGFALLSFLRATDRCRDMAVVVMTSSSAQADRQKSAALAVNDYFNKPSGYTEFLAIGQLIKKHLS